jgi:hypothetical protein
MPSPSLKRVRATSFVKPTAATMRSSSVAGLEPREVALRRAGSGPAPARPPRGRRPRARARRPTSSEARLSISCSRAWRARSSARRRGRRDLDDAQVLGRQRRLRVARARSRARQSVPPAGRPHGARDVRRALVPRPCAGRPRPGRAPRPGAGAAPPRPASRRPTAIRQTARRARSPASVTPGRSGSYGRVNTAASASRVSSSANHAAPGRMSLRSPVDDLEARTPLTSSSCRTRARISSSVCSSHAFEEASSSIPPRSHP